MVSIKREEEAYLEYKLYFKIVWQKKKSLIIATLSIMSFLPLKGEIVTISIKFLGLLTMGLQ